MRPGDFAAGNTIGARQIRPIRGYACREKKPELTFDDFLGINQPLFLGDPEMNELERFAGSFRENYEALPAEGKLFKNTGGDSAKLGKNMMESMDLPRGTNWPEYQAQHIIPAEMADHPVLQKIGMDLDDASNGLFLRTPADDISTMSRHRGYHSTYNEFVRTQLDGMDINQSADVLQNQVYDLQQNLKYLQQSGLPLYPSQGATVDLWQRSLERIQ